MIETVSKHHDCFESFLAVDDLTILVYLDRVNQPNLVDVNRQLFGRDGRQETLDS